LDRNRAFHRDPLRRSQSHVAHDRNGNDGLYLPAIIWQEERKRPFREESRQPLTRLTGGAVVGRKQTRVTSASRSVRAAALALGLARPTSTGLITHADERIEVCDEWG
jgi:hypothetical protein